jgi:diguanylate cyclase
MTSRIEIEELLQDAFQYYLDGNPQMALQCDMDALRMAQGLGDPHLIARASIEVSRSYRWLHKPKQAVEHIHNALALFNQFDDPALFAYACFIHARVLMQVGLSDDAYNESMKAWEWAEQNGDIELQVRVLDVQAIVFVIASNLEKAEILLDRAQAIQDEHNFASMRAVLPLHRGFFHSRSADFALEQNDEQGHKDHYQVALMWTEQAAKAAKENGQTWYQFVTLCNGAECAAVHGDFDTAEQMLTEVSKLPQGLMDVGAVHYLYTRSEVANRSGNHQLAISYGHKALEAAKANPDADNVMNAHRRVAEAYEAAGDFEAAFGAFKLYHNHFKKSLARRAYWQDRMAEYKSNVRDMRDQLNRANVHAEQMTKEAHQDALTGLGNRRAFDQAMLQLDADRNTAYALAILDLDHFKQINDEYSHLVGDDVLRIVANILQEHCRSTDLVARIGGEEFAILLPRASLENAMIICERIRKHIASYDWQALEADLGVTVSAGIAMSHEGRNTLDVFAVADARLYHAKSNGRDRVEAYALPAKGSDVSWA